MKESPRTAAAGAVRRIVQYCTSRGVDPRRLHREVGIDPGQLAIPDARVSIESVFDLWARLATTLRDAAIPIRVAESASLDDLHLLGFAIQTAPSLEQALQTLLRFGPLLTTSGHWSGRPASRHVELIWHRQSPPTLGVRLSNETAVAQLVRSLRQLASGDFQPVEVRFQHSAPDDIRAHESYFRSRIRFGTSENAVVIHRDLLDAASPWANPALWRYLCTSATTRLERVASSRFADAVIDEIARELEGTASRLPSIDAVASALGTTERTLRRRLRDESTTFRALTETARRERVLHLLQSPATSVTRAALEVGFSDPSALSHACKRWFGCTPRELRDRRLAVNARSDPQRGGSREHREENPVVFQ